MLIIDNTNVVCYNANNLIGVQVSGNNVEVIYSGASAALCQCTNREQAFAVYKVIKDAWYDGAAKVEILTDKNTTVNDILVVTRGQ